MPSPIFCSVISGRIKTFVVTKFVDKKAFYFNFDSSVRFCKKNLLQYKLIFLQVVDSIETYRIQQLEKLRENYNQQSQRIRFEKLSWESERVSSESVKKGHYITLHEVECNIETGGSITIRLELRHAIQLRNRLHQVYLQ